MKEKIKKNPVESMPGVFQYSIDRIDEILKEIDSDGISGLLIFGIPEHKDEQASEAYNCNGITQKGNTLYKKEISGYARHSRRLLMRIYVARSLRSCKK